MNYQAVCKRLSRNGFRASSTSSAILADYYNRQHLLRVHRIPVHCARCSQTFKTPDERDAHLRQQPECPLGPPQQWDGISETQKEQLGKRVSSKNTKQENWYSIYATLFPNSDPPKNPFVDDMQLSEDLSALREFAIKEAPGLIREFATSELPPDLRPSQEQVETFTQAALHVVFNTVLEKWVPNTTDEGTMKESVVPSHVSGLVSGSRDELSSNEQSETLANFEEPPTSRLMKSFPNGSSQQASAGLQHDLLGDIHEDYLRLSQPSDEDLETAINWNLAEMHDPSLFNLDSFPAF